MLGYTSSFSPRHRLWLELCRSTHYGGFSGFFTADIRHSPCCGARSCCNKKPASKFQAASTLGMVVFEQTRGFRMRSQEACLPKVGHSRTFFWEWTTKRSENVWNGLSLSLEKHLAYLDRPTLMRAKVGRYTAVLYYMQQQNRTTVECLHYTVLVVLLVRTLYYTVKYYTVVSILYTVGREARLCV